MVCSSAISMTHCDPNSSSVNREVFVTIIVLHIQLNTPRKVFRRLTSKPHLEAIKQRHDPNRQCRGARKVRAATLLLGGYKISLVSVYQGKDVFAMKSVCVWTKQLSKCCVAQSKGNLFMVTIFPLSTLAYLFYCLCVVK
jgi:hypothetical protein